MSLPSNKCNPETVVTEKELCLANDNQLHGSKRRIENGADGMTIQRAKIAEASGTLNIYLYVIMDVQMNIENGKLIDVLY